jgi:copper binding plastocyanin/azurin family protein
MMKTVRAGGTRRAKIRLAGFLGVAAVALGLIATTAWAVFQPIGAGDDFYTGGIGDPANPTFTMDQGERPTFTDGGVNQHNVTARQNGPDGRTLFTTPTINGGQSASLDGTQYLQAGTYTFFCTIHPTQMQATLVVTGSGTPQPRPSATLTIRAKKIAKVVKKGIPVALTTSAKIDDVSLVAKLGKATIGKAGDLSLAQGQVFETIKLSKAGKSKLRKKSAAKVSVTADIPFGAPARAKANLK